MIGVPIRHRAGPCCLWSRAGSCSAFENPATHTKLANGFSGDRELVLLEKPPSDASVWPIEFPHPGDFSKPLLQSTSIGALMGEDLSSHHPRERENPLGRALFLAGDTLGKNFAAGATFCVPGRLKSDSLSGI